MLSTPHSLGCPSISRCCGRQGWFAIAKEGRWSYYTLDAAGLKGAAATALGFTPSAALGTTGVGPTLQQLTPRSTQSDRVTIPAEVEADGSVDVEAPHGCCS